MPVTPQLDHHMKSRLPASVLELWHLAVLIVNNDAMTSATEESGAGVVISQLQCCLVELDVESVRHKVQAENTAVFKKMFDKMEALRVEARRNDVFEWS